MTPESEQIRDRFAAYPSVAFVGNGPQLLGARYGKEIDAHGAVVRFNDARTEGFEEDVGERMTARVVNVELQRGKKPLFSITPEARLAQFRHELLLFRPTVDGRINNIGRSLAHPSCTVLVMDITTRKDIFLRWGLKKPSTGFLAVCQFSRYFEAAEVVRGPFPEIVVYGFDGFQSERLHYFEPVTRRQKQPGHDGTLEMEIMRTLPGVRVVKIGSRRRINVAAEAAGGGPC